MFRYKKERKNAIISVSQEVSEKDCKKLILDNTRWEASYTFTAYMVFVFKLNSNFVFVSLLFFAEEAPKRVDELN